MIEVGKSYLVDAAGKRLTEPAKLDPQRAAYVRAFLPQLMQDFPPEGRDLLLEVDRIQDISKTREILDHLEWHFVSETGGYVLRGDGVHRGKQQLFAIFKNADQLKYEPTEGSKQ